MNQIKNIFFGFLFALIFVCGLFSFTPVQAVDAPYFSLQAAEGQGVGSDEFYVGRCFRVNIYLNTGGVNSNGADVEINYDDSVSEIVQSDCSTAATQITAGTLYNNYPGAGNTVSSEVISLSGYNNPGVSTNVANGLYGYFYVRITGATNSYPLTFEFTDGVTTDTNLAQTGGDGSDILNAVENITLKLVTDTDDPSVSNLSPLSGATGVSISSNVTFYANDLMSGINSAVTAVRMKKGAGAYVVQTASSGSVQTTNTNRNYRYTTTVNPNVQMKTNGGYYAYNTVYTVEATVTDVASTPHSAVQTWSFTTENDVAAPYITNRSPAADAVGVAANTNISFRVNDYKANDGSTPGMGVDSSTISVNVATSSGSITYTCASATVTCDVSNLNSVIVTIDPASNFSQNEVVTVTINASDSASPVNAMNAVTYSFSTEDTGAPTIANFTPVANSYGNSTSTNIVFDIIDTGAGVAIETLQVYINNTLYTAASDELTFVGDASSYRITINPGADFGDNIPVNVRISFRDQAPSQNYVSPNPTLFNFVIGLSATSGDCPVCAACTACPAVTCSGGNGGGTVYIEKQCPVCPTVPSTVNNCTEITTSEPKEIIKYIYVTTTIREVIAPRVDGNTPTRVVENTGNSQPIFPVGSIVVDEIPDPLFVSSSSFSLSAPNVPQSTAELQKIQAKTKTRTTILFSLIGLTSLAGVFIGKTVLLRNTTFGATLVLGILGMIFMNTNIPFISTLFRNKVPSLAQNFVATNKNGGNIFFGDRVQIPLFQGTLLDATTKKPVAQATVTLDNKSTQTDEAGKFTLIDIYSSDRITLTFKDSSSARVGIGNAPQKTYLVDPKIAEVVKNIEPLNAQRKFKSVYSYAAKVYRDSTTEQDFVNEKNKEILEKVTKYKIVDKYFDFETTFKPTWTSKKLNKTFNNVLTVQYVTVQLDDKNEVSEDKETWYFLQEDGEWKFVE